MKAPRVAVLDFETKKIQPRPSYPPRPVSFSLWLPEERAPKFYSWDHPEGNNCTESEAKRVLTTLWKRVLAEDLSLLMHHSKFDYDVARVGMKLRSLPWHKIHDTKFLLFLQNPYEKSLSLKPSAERILGMPPEERDAVEEWLKVNKPHLREAGESWGAYISEAPGTLVGPYANGDCIRTKRLFIPLYKEIAERGMLAAYDRERRTMPVLLENEIEGIRTDFERLGEDIPRYELALEKTDEWLRKRLGNPSLNFNSDAQVADALAAQGIVTDFALTKTGKRSVGKKSLTPDKFSDPRVPSAFAYRNKLTTFLGTFMRPFYLTASQTHRHTIHTDWKQVRGSSGGGDSDGARSGRKSSSPNFQNLPKDAAKKDPSYKHPAFLRSLPKLPLIRSYLLPDEGCSWGRRDYNQQELRILAHFEGGDLLQRYLDDPRFDMHTLVQEGVKEIIGILFERDFIKAFNFQDIYGGGIPAFCETLKCTDIVAKQVKSAKRSIMPGFAALEKEIKAMGAAGQPIITWGGREYYTEPPRYVEKFRRWTTFEYKLLNCLIQGSAADVTKEAVIRYHEHPKRQARFLADVHDEINISIPKGREKEEMTILRDVMQSVELDLPMLSDGQLGPSWGELTKWED